MCIKGTGPLKLKLKSNNVLLGFLFQDRWDRMFASFNCDKIDLHEAKNSAESLLSCHLRDMKSISICKAPANSRDSKDIKDADLYYIQILTHNRDEIRIK